MLKKLTSIMIFVIFGAFFVSPTLADDSNTNSNPNSKIEAMSAPEFWAQVMGIPLEAGKDVDYVICGPNVCKPQNNEICMVKKKIRTDHITQLSVVGGHFLNGLIHELRGDGTVVTYDYKCAQGEEVAKYHKKGWKDAPEGGYVQRRKTRTGGIFAKSKTKETSCYKGNDQKEYCLLTKEKSEIITRATVSYNKSGTAFRRCEVLPVKLHEARRCFFCPLFTVMYSVSNHITSISFDKFATPFAYTIAMGLALWIAIQVLVFVSSITKQDAPKFLTNLVKQSYKFVIAFVFLISSMQIYEIVVVPIMRGGLQFGSEMLDSRYSVVKTASGLTDWERMEEINPGIRERSSKITLKPDKDEEYYDANLYVDLDNYIAQIQRTIAFMQATGTSLICIGSHAMIFMGDTLEFGDGFQLVVEGVLLAGFGFLISISIAFYLIDAIVQLGLLGALMPFLIASWPFKLTAKYSSTGWNMFLNAVFLFMFSGLVISISINLVDAGLKYSVTAQECSGNDCKGDEVEMGALYKIAQAINTQDEENLKKLTDISSIGFLILLFSCIFGFKFLSKSSEISGKFASGAISPNAPKIATMAGSAAKSFALKSTKSTRETIENKAKRAGSALLHPIQTAKGIGNTFKSAWNEKDSDNDNNNTDDTSNSKSKNTSNSSQNQTNSSRPTVGQTVNGNTVNTSQKPTVGEKKSDADKKTEKKDKKQELKDKTDKAQNAGKRNKKNNKSKDSSAKQRKRMQKRSRTINRK